MNICNLLIIGGMSGNIKRVGNAFLSVFWRSTVKSAEMFEDVDKVSQY
jgi:hypothetical protein